MSDLYVLRLCGHPTMVSGDLTALKVEAMRQSAAERSADYEFRWDDTPENGLRLQCRQCGLENARWAETGRRITPVNALATGRWGRLPTPSELRDGFAALLLDETGRLRPEHIEQPMRLLVELVAQALPVLESVDAGMFPVSLHPDLDDACGLSGEVQVDGAVRSCPQCGRLRMHKMDCSRGRS